MKRVIKPIYAAVLAVMMALLSCSKDEHPITRFSDTMIEGEDSVLVIPTVSRDWQISCIYSTDGLPLYDAEGKPLQLPGMGTVEYSWFKVERTEANALQIAFQENFGESTRGIVLELVQPDGNSEMLTVRQKESQGYTFVRIDYSLNDGDGVTLVHSQPIELQVDSLSADSSFVQPYRGIVRSVQFISDDKDAFAWTRQGEVQFKVPADISGDEIIYGAEMCNYDNQLRQSRVAQVQDTARVAVPSGKSKILSSVIYKKMELTYELTLMNRRTKAFKHIQGKWVQTEPVNCSFD